MEPSKKVAKDKDKQKLSHLLCLDCISQVLISPLNLKVAAVRIIWLLGETHSFLLYVLQLECSCIL